MAARSPDAMRFLLPVFLLLTAAVHQRDVAHEAAEERGWHEATIGPRGPIPLDPAQAGTPVRREDLVAIAGAVLYGPGLIEQAGI